MGEGDKEMEQEELGTERGREGERKRSEEGRGERKRREEMTGGRSRASVA